MMSQENKLLIKGKIKSIGLLAQSRGYRGILGIEFILKSQQLFFMEFNTRFQVSSQLINKSLHKYYGLSLQKLNLKSFEEKTATAVEPFSVEYSNYVYTSSNISNNRLKRIVNSPEIYNVQTDGYNEYDVSIKENDIYLNSGILYTPLLFM